MSVTINGTTGISGVAGTASAPALVGSDADSGFFINSANEPSASVNGTAVWNAASTFGFKNRIINGAMMIDQRNAGASGNSNGFYPVDRTYQLMSGGGVLTSQRSTTAPAGFVNSIFTTVSTADASIASTDYYLLRHIIEGLNLADMAWGTASAQPFTISFWVRSSVTGTFSGGVNNGTENRGYAFTYVINSANTWEYKTVTIAGDTSGTWATDNTQGMYVNFDLGSGSSRKAASGSWVAQQTLGATGAVNLISTLNATFYITGVQLEKGSTATSFDYRPYGTELALCQRYYYTATASAMGCLSATKTFFGYWALPTSMRTKPSVAQSGTVTVYGVNFADFGTSNPALNTDFGVSGGVVNFSGASTAGGSVGLGAWVYGSGTLQFSAEL